MKSSILAQKVLRITVGAMACHAQSLKIKVTQAHKGFIKNDPTII